MTAASTNGLSRAPRGAGEDYPAARRRLLAAERALRDRLVEQVAVARRALPPGPGIDNYSLLEGPADLSDPSPAAKVV